MKSVHRLLFPVCAIALIWILLKDRPGQDGQPVTTHSESRTAAAVPAVSETTQPPPVPAPATVPNLPLPRTTSELNAFTDGPQSLEEKMSVFTRMMREAPPEQAKAAAVRAVFVVKNADFAARLQPLILAADLKPEAMEVLGLNLYDRPLDVLLPVWAAIRTRPEHPLYHAAVDGLEFHLKEKATASGPQLARVIKEYLHPAQR
ncbi:MAG TPA: hypothetical protein VG796_10255 [Verrucomicrobiales bacterium]|nr:hypothetical protein [Verrucomicrobiales bacterium]